MEKPNKKNKIHSFRNAGRLILMLLVIMAIVGIFSFPGSFFGIGKSSGGITPAVTVTAPATPTPTTLTPEPDLSAKATLTSVGDIILHQAVIDGGLSKDGTYQYDYLFEYVSPIFNRSDYTVANYEGTLNGTPYTGYPAFCAPDAIATAIKNAGIDMVTTANNHAYDRKLAGLKRTPDVFRKAGVEVIGTRSAPEDPKYSLITVNGIRIGITGYTYETTGNGTQKALNGVNLTGEAALLVDSFNPYRAAVYEKNKEEMASRIQSMKTAGAECVIFILHWGEEYKTVSNSYQKKLAQYLSDQGVDVIIGHHPHVIQEISVVSSSVSGKNTLVYYSLGNFLANMSFNTHNTKGYAEDALIAQIEIERNKTGEISIVKGGYIGTYVYKNRNSSKVIHKIIPVRSALNAPDEYGMKSQVSLLKNAAARISKVVSAGDGIHGGILIQEVTE